MNQKINKVKIVVKIIPNVKVKDSVLFMVGVMEVHIVSLKNKLIKSATLMKLKINLVQIDVNHHKNAKV